MNDLQVVRLHEKRWLLNHVVPDVDDEVGAVDGAVQRVVGRQRGVAQKERVALVDDALAHLGGEEWDAGVADEVEQHLGGALAVGSGPDEQQGALRVLNQVGGLGDGLFLGDGSPHAVLGKKRRVGLFAGYIFGQF